LAPSFVLQADKKNGPKGPLLKTEHCQLPTQPEKVEGLWLRVEGLSGKTAQTRFTYPPPLLTTANYQLNGLGRCRIPEFSRPQISVVRGGKQAQAVGEIDPDTAAELFAGARDVRTRMRDLAASGGKMFRVRHGWKHFRQGLRHLANRHRAASANVEDTGTNISSGLGAAMDKTKEEPKKRA